MKKDSILDFFIDNEGLTATAYRDRSERYFIPLAEQILSWKVRTPLYRNEWCAGKWKIDVGSISTNIF